MISGSSGSRLCCSRSSDKTQTSSVAAYTADPFARERDSDQSLSRTKRAKPGASRSRPASRRLIAHQTSCSEQAKKN